MTILRSGARIFAIAATLSSHAHASAQIMTDPTRPPRSAAAAQAGAEAAGEAPSAPVLQSVMITPTRRSAIIGGERVELGGRYGEAQVVKITESEVVLRSGGRTEVLKMYPDVDKKTARSAQPASALPPGGRR
jgi:MSHA biogenesis protein MshK